MNKTTTVEHNSSHRRKLWEYFTFSTDHKVIGIQYLATSFLFFFIGGAFAEVVRTELATPDPDFVTPEVYNQMFTLHGTIMIFLWIVGSMLEMGVEVMMTSTSARKARTKEPLRKESRRVP